MYLQAQPPPPPVLTVFPPSRAELQSNKATLAVCPDSLHLLQRLGAQKVYNCKVSVGSQTAEKSIKKSECEE
ncbi:hypothetical protein D4764_0220200 [Takifugu flavidus]|uniref:Uncharacterized protein n=1 Tax=Takifugu flavidus TaxID=433684 RepID=A0A5C6MDR2_9TELE|nr:hypothetical protein D4764_0220200 [Takifugu flavidus]